MRLLAIALAALALAPVAAGAGLPVVVDETLGLDDLEGLSRMGAVGLLVPGAGPEVRGSSALASLERGAVESSLRGGVPDGPRVIRTTRTRPASGPYLLVSLPVGGTQPNDRRYPVVLVGGERGLLGSSATRIPGLVAIADLAPAALGGDELRVTEAEHPAAELRALDARIAANRDTRLPATFVWAIGLALLALVRPRAAAAGVALLLLANLACGALGLAGWDAAALLVVAAAGGLLAARLPLVPLLVATLAAYCVSFLVDPAWIALSPLGPTQNARFHGLSNLLATLLLVPTLVAGALLPPLGLLAVGALALVTAAGSSFGADGGGALVLAAGLGLLAALRLRRPLAGAAAVVLGVAALYAVDLLRGAETHVTRAIGGGPGELAEDLADRLELSWARATASPGAALAVLLGLAGLVVLARRARDPLPVAFLAAVGVSLLVNDSPTDVAVIGFLCALVVVRLPRRTLDA